LPTNKKHHLKESPLQDIAKINIKGAQIIKDLPRIKGVRKIANFAHLAGSISIAATHLAARNQ